MDDVSYEDKEGNISAILIGTKEWSLDGEPLKEDLTDKTLIIEINHLDSIKNEKVIKVKELNNDSTLKLFYKLIQ